MHHLRVAAVLAAVAVLAACSGGGGGKSTTNALLPPAHVGSTASGTVTIAGVGDSLTAGEQSDGTMGADLPIIEATSPLGQIGPVQRTQEHGFFALLWEQANGVDITTMSNPATSPLPLLTPPGLGSILAPTAAGFPYSGITTPCDAHQIAANTFSTALSLRENPALNPWDVGIPGQTTHEALYMVGPTGNCSVNASNSPASFVDLNALVNGESQIFWPILAGFGQGVTQVEAAASLHAQLATVWLGSNDLLKFALSDGAAPVTAPASIQADITAIIKQLQAAGSKVAVANLVDVMGAATFIPVTPSNPSQLSYQNELALFILRGIEEENPTIPASVAQGIANQYATAYAQQEIAQTGLGNAGYFTINALFATLQTALTQIQTQATPVAPTIPAGDVVPDAVATEVETLNTAYNASIAAAASATDAALVDMHTAFVQIEQAGGLPVNPPACCSLIYGGGFFSLDGLHPSNTGYAVLANLFIDKIDSAYGMSIPEVNVSTIYATDPYAPGNGVSGSAHLRKTVK
ncbi:MAG TPA: hypothetical protein VMD91_17480 [Candidatus Sulfotelmatobacter sp.]|nr:hypothetical protein [Candidatus Sulfotelmatobacter sp.]